MGHSKFWLRVPNWSGLQLAKSGERYAEAPKDLMTFTDIDLIEQLVDAGIEVGLTTAGITLLRLYRDHRSSFDRLNDVDISFDSPFEAEHNKNRGANLYHQAVE